MQLALVVLAYAVTAIVLVGSTFILREALPHTRREQANPRARRAAAWANATRPARE